VLYIECVWIFILNFCRLKREYTGDWFDDNKHGRGTYFYKNNDRYDGYNLILSAFF
jgi:hypothetical protein